MASGAKTGGRKKGTPNKATADVKAAAQKFTEAALKTLSEIMRNSESDQARVAAANSILDRGHGRPKQFVDLDANVAATFVIETGVPRAETN